MSKNLICGVHRSDAIWLSEMEPRTSPLFLSKSIARFMEEEAKGYVKSTGELFVVTDWKIVESITREGKTITDVVEKGRTEGCELVADEFLEFDWKVFYIDEMAAAASSNVFDERTVSKLNEIYKQTKKKWFHYASEKHVIDRDIDQLFFRRRG